MQIGGGHAKAGIAGPRKEALRHGVFGHVTYFIRKSRFCKPFLRTKRGIDYGRIRGIRWRVFMIVGRRREGRRGKKSRDLVAFLSLHSFWGRDP